MIDFMRGRIPNQPFINYVIGFEVVAKDEIYVAFRLFGFPDYRNLVREHGRGAAKAFRAQIRAEISASISARERRLYGPNDAITFSPSDEATFRVPEIHDAHV